MLQTVNNVRIRNTLLALARAHTSAPGFEMSKATGLAHRINALAAEEQTMHVAVALVILLLQAIGVHDAGDVSRLSRG